MTVKVRDGKYIIFGTVVDANTSRDVGRTYDIDSLKAAVDKYNEVDANFGQIFPDEVGSEGYPLTTDMSEVSHKVVSLKYNDDDTVTAELELLDTPMGKLVKEIIEEPMRLGVSARNEFDPTPIMVGVVSEDKVVNDLSFSRIDVIATEKLPDID